MEKRAAFVSDEVERHGQAVKRFQSLCDMHRVSLEETGRLRSLIAHLREDRHFAMDFWAMTGDLSARERGSLSDEEMLGVIVEGATGAGVEALPEDEKKAAEDLKQILAGVDVGAGDLPDPIARPQDALLAGQEASSLRKAELSSAQHRIAEALLRLEQTSRELREQLEALGQVEGTQPAEAKIEEAGEALAAAKRLSPEEERPAAKEEAVIAPVAEPVIQIPQIRAPQEMESAPIIREREVFPPKPVSSLFGQRLVIDPDDDPSIAVPLEAYAASSRRRLGVRIAMAVIVLLAAGALWFAVSRGYAREMVESYTPALQEKLRLFREEVRDLGKSKDATAPKPSAVPAATATAAPAPPAPVAAAPPPVQEPAKDTSQKQAGEETERKPQAAPQAAQPAGHEPPPSPDLDESVRRVPASVMESRLVASRVPVYPEAAKARGIAGTVVMEAVISRSGSVERVRVLEGDTHLRAAAQEAVMKRRYEPYVVNGSPVEVATEVRVVFRLPE